MSKGDSWAMDILRQEDPDTGAVVERLTDNTAPMHHPYFTRPVISADGRYVLAVSDRGEGRQLFALDLDAEQMVQLTDDSNIGACSSCLDPAAGLVYYWSGRSLRMVSITGGEVSELYACPEGYSPGGLSISSCGRYLAFPYVEQLPISTQTGRIYSDQAERLFQRPRSVLMRLDVQQGSAQALYGETEWYTHVSISPTDADIVLFCREGAWMLVQRMWITRADTQEVWPLLETKRLLAQCGHEYFTTGGTVVTQYSERTDVRDNTWRQANVLINPDGSNRRTFWYDGSRPGHVQTSHNDETLMVGDCAWCEQIAKPDGDKMMSLIRLVDDRSEVTPLCRHDTSWTAQISHPHPVFWPDDQWIMFNSDRGGQCNIYRVRIPQ